MHILELFGWSMALQVLWWNSIASLWKRQWKHEVSCDISTFEKTSKSLTPLREVGIPCLSFSETIEHNSSKWKPNRTNRHMSQNSGPVIGIADPIRVLKSFRMFCCCLLLCYIAIGMWLRDFPEEHGQSWKVSRKQGQQAPSNLDRPRRLSVSTLNLSPQKLFANGRFDLASREVKKHASIYASIQA